MPFMPKRALVVGLGSMGKRYARLLTEDVIEPEGLYLCDTNEKRLEGISCAYASTDLGDMLKRLGNDGGPHISIIATPAEYHLDILAGVVDWFPESGFLIEKPLTDGALCDHPKLATLSPILFTRCIALGYNWRFHPFVERTKQFREAITDISLYVADEMDNWPGRYGLALGEFSHEIDLIRVLTRIPQVSGASYTTDGYKAWGTHSLGKWKVRIRPHHSPKGRWCRMRLHDESRIAYSWNVSEVEDTYRKQLHNLVDVWSVSGKPDDLSCSLAEGVATSCMIDEIYEHTATIPETFSGRIM